MTRQQLLLPTAPSPPGYKTCQSSSTEAVNPFSRCLQTALRVRHWLPVKYRIQYKLCLLMHSVSTQRCPAYLSQLVQPVANSTCRHGLKSSNSQFYAVPRTRTKLGERAFSVAGPSAWNPLPDNLRCNSDTPSFKHQLKTHLFTIAFDV